MHVEFDLADSNIRYECGDHLALLAPNNETLTKTLLEILGIPPERYDEKISLVALDEDAPKKNPFPCPTTWWYAFK